MHSVNLEGLVRWALYQPISAAPKLVLIHMAIQCNNPFLQVPFNNRAAARTLKMNIKTVRRALVNLECFGLISHRGKKQIDDYRYLNIWQLHCEPADYRKAMAQEDSAAGWMH